MRVRSLIPGLVLAFAQTASAQYQTRTWVKWRTVEAGRFAVHFPQELESWARVVAGKTAAIDSAVTRVVGYRPPQRIDIVIDDPFHIANGSAWPLLDAPRIVMWATPPDPRNDIGNFVSWADMLTTHEFTHLAHLLRPTRNRFQNLLWKLAPVELGPISRKAPRWVIEGYATYVEGVVTGSGRPNGIWRPTILRQWAIEGILPRYDQLNSTSGMYGGEFAYLAGSSFLEWLAQRRGDSSLVALWRRMSATRDRGFVEAFAGVYGEAPDILYGRFTAELTSNAKARVAQMRGDTGTAVQHLARETGDPAIAHNGGRAAIVLASATRPGRVVIWQTIADADTAADRAAAALVKSDPQDVPPYRPFPPPKRVLAKLDAVGNQSYQDPRFFADGRVLVWRNTALGNGEWRPDFYIWDPQRGSVRRITRGANVQKGDPSPTGTSIVATRCGGGKCDLVVVETEGGDVTVIGEGSDTRSYYRPRFSPSGRTIAVSVHDGGFWRAGLVDLETRALQIITRDDRNYFDLAFVDDSTLVASSDDAGIPNVVKLRLSGVVVGRLTNVSGAAVAPEPNHADGSIWFLSLHARGWDVRAARGAPVAVADAAGGTARREFPVGPLPPSRRYAPDRKWIWFPGGNLVRDGGSLLLGVTNTDPVGKLEFLFQGAKSYSPTSFNAGLEGGTIAITQRRLSMTLSGFAVRQPGPFWYELGGGALHSEGIMRRERTSLRGLVGVTWSAARSPGEDGNRFLYYLDESFSASRFRSGRRTTATVGANLTMGERAGIHVDRNVITGAISSTEIPFALTAQWGYTTSGPVTEHFVLGGNPPTMLPTGVVSQFIAQPALSPFFVGKRLETYRFSIPFAGVRLYGWAGRAYTGEAPRLEQVLGAEYTASIVAIPVLGTPAARVLIGAGRWMNHHTVLRQDSFDSPAYVAPGGNIQFYITTQFGDWTR